MEFITATNRILIFNLFLLIVLLETVADETERFFFQNNPITLKIDVNASAVVFVVDSRFYSLGQGASLRFSKEVNLSSPVLQQLARELAPAYWRLGGTNSDFIIFKEDDSLGVHKSYSNITLTGEVWDSTNKFADKVGWDFVFAANVFLRTPDNTWDNYNFVNLLDYNSKKGFSVHFELGNEPNTFQSKFNKTIEPEQLASDFKTLRNILQQSALYKDKLLIGPDVSGMVHKTSEVSGGTDYLKRFLSSIDSTTDVTSTHFYYLNKADEPTVEKMTDPDTLDLFSQYAQRIAAIVESLRPPTRQTIWVGESGGISGGGMKGFSDRYVSGMVWLDKLGLGALNKIKVIIRETFLSSIRSLVDHRTIIPNVDYWSAILYKRLVGREALQIIKSGQNQLPLNITNLRRIRMYAHCTRVKGSEYNYQPGMVTIFGINFDKNKAVELELGTVHVDQFLLMPVGPDRIVSRRIALNGYELSLINTTLPVLSPRILQTHEKPVLPPGSMGFFILKDIDLKICKN